MTVIPRGHVDGIISFLNDLVALDPKALTELVENRVPCNEALVDHPTVQIQERDSETRVGLLGILNGMLEEPGQIIAVFTENGKELSHFMRSPFTQAPPLDITVARHDFGEGTRYDRQFPPPKDPHVEHHICNCTRVIQTPIPEQEIHQTSQGVDFTAYRHGREVRCFFVHRTTNYSEPEWSFPHLNFYWSNEKGERQHAYFWWSDGHCKIEINGTGENGSINCSLIQIFIGQPKNAGRLFMGHSQSPLLATTPIRDDDVWAYGTAWSGEGIAVLASRAEREEFLQMRVNAQDMQSAMRHHNQNHFSPEEIYDRVKGDEMLLGLVGRLVLWGEDLLNQYSRREFFSCHLLASLQAEEQLREKEQARRRSER